MLKVMTLTAPQICSSCLARDACGPEQHRIPQNTSYFPPELLWVCGWLHPSPQPHRTPGLSADWAPGPARPSATLGLFFLVLGDLMDHLARYTPF